MNLDKLQQNEDLFPHNTLRIHSVAQYFFIARSMQELIEVVQLARTENLPLTLLGGGSNTVITRDTIPGIVVRNLYMSTKKVKETEEYVDISVSTGYPVVRLVTET